MGRIKALTLVSIAAITVVAQGGARAADLLPSAPPIEEPLRGGFVEESGFYLRGDIGVANTNASDLTSTYGDGNTLASLGTTEGPVSAGDPFLLGLGIGYQFNNWLRADVTGEYRNSINYHASSIYQFNGSPNCDPSSGIFCGDEYTGQIKTGLFLANGYFDIGTWRGLTPYVGGGLGIAAYQVSALKDTGLYPNSPGSFGFAPNYSGTNFAWALMAGVSYRLSPNLLLDVGYRYVNMGTFKTGAIFCNNQIQYSCHFETQHFNMASNDLRVGMRWMPGDLGYVDPPVRAKY